MSPSYFSGSAFEWIVAGNADLIGRYVANSGGLRPSVSLKGAVEILSGDGTVNNPYRVIVPEPEQS